MSDETKTPEAETADTIAKLKSELRDAGEAGKKQWEDAFVKTREALHGGSDRAVKVAGRTREALEQVYARAQQRGADLLLKLVSHVRAGAESFEASLRARATKASEAGSPDGSDRFTETTPATAS